MPMKRVGFSKFIERETHPFTLKKKNNYTRLLAINVNKVSNNPV